MKKLKKKLWNWLHKSCLLQQWRATLTLNSIGKTNVSKAVTWRGRTLNASSMATALSKLTSRLIFKSCLRTLRLQETWKRSRKSLKLPGTKSFAWSLHNCSILISIWYSNTSLIWATLHWLMELSTLVWTMKDHFLEWRCQMQQNSRTVYVLLGPWHTSLCQVTLLTTTWSESWSKAWCWTRPLPSSTSHTTRLDRRVPARSPSTSYSPRSSHISISATTA